MEYFPIIARVAVLKSGVVISQYLAETIKEFGVFDVYLRTIKNLLL